MAVRELDARLDQVSVYYFKLIKSNKLDPITVTTEVRPTWKQLLWAVNDPGQTINLPARPAKEIYKQIAASVMGLTRLVEELGTLMEEEEE